MSNLVEDPFEDIWKDKNGIGGEDPADLKEIIETLNGIVAIRDELHRLRSLRDRASNAVMSVPILNAWGRDLGSAVEELASRYLLAIEEIDSLKSRLDRMQLAERAGVCKWQPDEGFDYTCINTGCGQSFVFEDGYEDGDHTYCSHCGRKIQYVPQPELEEGGEG